MDINVTATGTIVTKQGESPVVLPVDLFVFLHPSLASYLAFSRSFIDRNAYYTVDANEVTSVNNAPFSGDRNNLINLIAQAKREA